MIGSSAGESSKNLLWIFIVEAGIYLALLFFSNQYIVTDHLLAGTQQLLSGTRASVISEAIQKSRQLSYILLPIGLGIKLLFIGCIIYTVLLLFNQNLKFRKILAVVLMAELVFVIAAMVRILALGFFTEINSVEDIAAYSHYSLASLLPPDTSGPLSLLLSSLHIFEFVYILVLAWLLADILEIKLTGGLKYVLLSYGSCLLAWILLLSFIQQLLTPR